MSAALSDQNESKQQDLTGVGQDNKAGQVALIKGWRTMLSTATALFAQPGAITGTTEPFGWAKKGTVVVSLAVALLGGFTKFSDYIKTDRTAYNLEVPVGQLTMSYRPEHEQIRLMLDFKATETGLKNNEILPGKAWVKAPSLISGSDTASSADISLFEGAFRLPKAVIVRGAEPREMKCFIDFHLDDNTREVFQTSGLHRLVVELKCKDKICQLTFCFELNDSAIDGLLNSKEIRYLTQDQLIES